MEVLRKDFDAVWNHVADLFLNGSDTLIAKFVGSPIKKDNYQELSGLQNLDFIRHKPDQASMYQIVDLPALYHILDAARMLQLTKFSNTQTINLTGLLKQWDQLQDIHHRFRTTDWDYDYSDPSGVRLISTSEQKQFVAQLQLHESPESKALLRSMWGIHVPESCARIPEFLSLKNLVMKNETPSHNERQFNRIGMQELYTADVKQKLMAGNQRISHGFSKSIDGVTVSGTLYLNKAKEGSDYFINKFNLSKIHEKNGQEISQTFYVNNRTTPRIEGQGEIVHQQWTMKRAFNFLAGRPVYDRLSKSWDQIDLSKKLANGNFATQRYGENYGVNLDKILSSYNITARGNNEKMEQIKEGIERGNMQPVQFNVSEGGLETYKIALSIRTGSLRIYDAKNNEVPLETQVERKMISDELKNTLIELYARKQKQPEQNIHDQPAGTQQENKQSQHVSQKEKGQQQQTNSHDGDPKKDKKHAQRNGKSNPAVKDESGATGSRKSSHKQR